MNETWLIACAGIACGVLLGIAAGRMAGGFLFGVTPYDRPTVLTAVLIIGVVATFVGCFPAVAPRRWTRRKFYATNNQRARDVN